uniref:Uncharacterized protein n=1 Tax=Anguilla anguilla TaxID=7936 RepID=A0A0E9TQM7_ANGAN
MRQVLSLYHSNRHRIEWRKKGYSLRDENEDSSEINTTKHLK